MRSEPTLLALFVLLVLVLYRTLSPKSKSSKGESDSTKEKSDKKEKRREEKAINKLLSEVKASPSEERAFSQTEDPPLSTNMVPEEPIPTFNRDDFWSTFENIKDFADGIVPSTPCFVDNKSSTREEIDALLTKNHAKKIEERRKALERAHERIRKAEEARKEHKKNIVEASTNAKDDDPLTALTVKSSPQNKIITK